MSAVSVVIPAYNRAQYLPQAVESVLAQTFKDVEIIVVDDGSTDGTREALAPFMDKIRYVRQENRGQAAARNRGAHESSGEFIAFLDSDDRWEPERLDAMRRCMDSHPGASAVATASRVCRQDGTPTDRVLGKKTPGDFFSMGDFLGKDKGSINGAGVLVRRDVFERLGGFDETLRSAEDCDMWLRLSMKGGIVMLPRPLLLYRMHENQVSLDMARDAENWLRILDKLERQKEIGAGIRALLRRARAKQELRLGRETLARSGSERNTLVEARKHLWNSAKAAPFLMRAWIYLAWSYLYPSGYAALRRAEMRRRRAGA